MMEGEEEVGSRVFGACCVEKRQRGPCTARGQISFWIVLMLQLSADGDPVSCGYIAPGRVYAAVHPC